MSPDVTRLYEEWRRCWRELDGAAMVRLFVRDGQPFIYQAEEFPKPFATAEKLERYWASVPAQAIERIEKWDQVSVESVALGEVTVLEVLTDTILRLHGNLPPVTGVLRSSLVIEGTGEQARIAHYHESRALKLGLIVA